MMSSVFPIYLLGNEMLKDKRKAIVISLFSLLIPELTLSFYLVQEVLCYPISLWIIYLVYLKLTKEEKPVINIILPILFAVIYFVKSYAIVFGLGYFITLTAIALKEKKYKEIKKIVFEFLLFAITIALLTIRSLFS